MINDVPARVGKTQKHLILGRIDNAENILANKITALLDRNEPKDLADIWGFCCVKGLSIQDAIVNAQGKAADVFPADLGRALCSVTKEDWETIVRCLNEWVEAEGEKKRIWMILPTFFYAQVVKQQKRFRLVNVEQRHIWGLPSEYRTFLKAAGLSGNINTSFVERVNLTIRQSISTLTRRAWGTAQYPPELLDHLYWWLIYYHFLRYHESLRIRMDKPIQRKGKQRTKEYRRMTPVVVAGLTNRRWSVLELISYPLA